jgi:acetate kinase
LENRGFILVREPILVINAGSSSTKFSVFETKPDRSLLPVAHGLVDGIGAQTGMSPRIEVADAEGRKLINEAIVGNDHKSAMAAIHSWFAVSVACPVLPVLGIAWCTAV